MLAKNSGTSRANLQFHEIIKNVYLFHISRGNILEIEFSARSLSTVVRNLKHSSPHHTFGQLDVAEGL